MKIIKELQLTPARQQQIISHLETLPLKADVSNYAKGRQRIWIGMEPFLGADRSKDRPGHVDDKVFDYCTRVFKDFFAVSYILVTFSTEQATGISYHRDAGYCKGSRKGEPVKEYAGTINLGGALFGIKDRAEKNEQLFELTGGEVIVFDSKAPHFCNPQPNRWAIHCWQGKK